MKSNKIVFGICFVLITIGMTSDSFAEQNGEIQMNISYNNGDVADYNGIRFVVYQDFSKEPFLEKIATSNPEIILVPMNHRYKVEVFANDMFAGYGITDLKNVKNILDVKIPLSGGLQLQVKYNDKESPVSDATVAIKSHLGNEWRRGETNTNGETLRFWIQPTKELNEYYLADVFIGENLITTQEIKLPEGISTDKEIILPIPKVVDQLITITLYKDTQKVTKNEGSYKVILRDNEGNNIQSEVNIRGEAYFSLLKSGEYTLNVIPPNNEESWPEKNLLILGNQNQFNVFMIKSTPESDKTEPKKEHVSCDCVAFRFDDVQDFWLNEVQIQVINQFIDKNTPVTLSIIADSFGNDKKLTNFIKNSTKNSEIEIADHGVGNTPLTELDYTNQELKITESKNKIKETLGITSNVFVPPQNRFNEDTLNALIKNKYTHLSSSTLFDSPPFPLNEQKIYRFPQTATTGTYNPTKNIFEGEKSENTISDVIKSIETVGFAVITMHPQEFSIVEDGVYSNQINRTQIQQLVKVIEGVTSKGFKIVPIGKINLDSNIVIPDWIKNNAGWWANDQIDNNTFVQALQYLIREKIIIVPQVEQTGESAKEIPVWIKNNAGWWANDQITDTDFIKGIEYLISNGIIRY